MEDFQRELFDEFGDKEKRKGRFFKRPESKHVTFSVSLETLLLGTLLLVMGMVVVYAMGVEMGRRGESRPKKEFIVKASRPFKKEEVKKAKAFTRTFTVQVASFVKREAAERAIENLRKKGKGKGAFLIPGPGQIAVCVGVYEKREDADRALDELKKLYGDAFVRNRKD